MVDTSDSRTQLTLENQAVAQLPVVGRNLVTLVTLAPGVSGLGTGEDRRSRDQAWITSPPKSRWTPAPTVKARTTTVCRGWAGRDQRNSPRCFESDPATRRHSGNQHSGQHVFERVQPRRRTANHVYDQVWDGPVPRFRVGLFQLPGNVRDSTSPAPTCLSTPTTWASR